MTDEQHKRFVIFMVAYFVLAIAFIMVLIFGTIYLITKDDEDCVWEDCARLMDLPSDPQCLHLGDTACLVVPQ